MDTASTKSTDPEHAKTTTNHALEKQIDYVSTEDANKSCIEHLKRIEEFLSRIPNAY
ncbi:MAG: hypothetical protein RLZZ308_754 [Candidatus Parcubacteria bacterium]|jgi:hypothetical protein